MEGKQAAEVAKTRKDAAEVARTAPGPTKKATDHDNDVSMPQQQHAMNSKTPRGETGRHSQKFICLLVEFAA